MTITRLEENGQTHTSSFSQWQQNSGVDYGWIVTEVFYESKKVYIKANDKRIVLDFETAAALVQFLAPRVTEGRVER